MDDETENANFRSADSSGCQEEKEEDLHRIVEKLTRQIKELEAEKRKTEEQYGVQRGKMKDLFIQTEEEKKQLREEMKELRMELDNTRSEVTVAGLDLESRLEQERLKAREELDSLQHLLDETLEQSSRYESELATLRQRNEKLEAELVGVVGGREGGGGGAPLLAVPGAVFGAFARKVASQLGAADTQQQHENLEESMHKAKEGAEMLKSLLLPLEEEIVELKKKLRETDTQLRMYQSQDSSRVDSPPCDSLTVPSGEGTTGNSPADETSSVSPDVHRPPPGCERCRGLEAQLDETRRRLGEATRDAAALDRCKEQLAEEVFIRHQMENKWTEKKEHHKLQVAELQGKMKVAEETLADMRNTYMKMCKEIGKQFVQLKEERIKALQDMHRVEQENERLVGKHAAHSRELQNEMIDLPDQVEALQELWLQQREELIRARVGQERLEETVESLESFLKQAEEKCTQLTIHTDALREELQKKTELVEALEKTVKSGKQHLADLNLNYRQLEEEKRQLEKNEVELKTRMASLQTGLENGEAVQKDFVRLSQSLQKELENLRAQNNVLRWEFEEDVAECRGCEEPFKSPKRKDNCKHCGRIFCETCLGRRVVCGPSGRKARVCEVCHTLLDKEKPPYFSTEPPQLH